MLHGTGRIGRTISRTAVLCCVALYSMLVLACGAEPTPQPTATQPPPTPIPTQPPTATPVPTPEPTEVPIPADRYQEPGDYLDNIVVGGDPRLFTVHIPPGYQPGVPMPLVVNLHGRTSTALDQEAVSRMSAKADQEGFIVVGPQALGEVPTWWGPIPDKVGQPDMDFFAGLMDYLQREISIDPNRIYATGLSNGATMANRLACDMSGTFAAIAPVSGGHVAHDLCEASHPVSVLAIHGTDDAVIPYYGNEIDTPPVHAWVEAWAMRNGCAAEAGTSHPAADILQETWPNCDAGVNVTLLSLEGGGHTWPGAPMGVVLGSVSQHIDATDVIWDFFESFPKPSNP